jgi:hypothetical protein
MTRSLVFFTRSLPSPLSQALELAGHRVSEALAVSEVLHLCEHEDIDCVVISSDVSDEAAKVVADAHVTLRLHPEATAGDVLWELSLLFGGPGAVQ